MSTASRYTIAPVNLPFGARTVAEFTASAVSGSLRTQSGFGLFTSPQDILDQLIDETRTRRNGRIVKITFEEIDWPAANDEGTSE